MKKVVNQLKLPTVISHNIKSSKHRQRQSPFHNRKHQNMTH